MPKTAAQARPADLKRTVRRLLSYMGHAKFSLLAVGVLASVAAIASLAGTYMVRPIVNGLATGGEELLAKQVILTAIIYAAGVLSALGYSQIMVRAAQHVVSDIRRDLFAHIQTLPLSYFDSMRSGDIMSFFTNDVDTVSEALNNSFANVIQAAIQVVGTTAMLIILNWQLTIITLVCDAAIVLYARYSGARSKRFFAAQQASLGDLDGYIEEMVSGQKVIKVFNHEAAAKAGFTGLNDTYRDAATRAQAYAGAMMPAMGNLSHINYAITCCIGGLLAIRTGDLGGLSAFLQYTKQVSQPITQISQQVNTILSAVAGAERVFEIMEAEPEVDDGKVTLERVKENPDGTLTEADYDTGAWAWKKPDGSLVPLRGDVRFDHVVFGYDDRKIILHDISLFAKPGQKIAFVGSTGAGKTTITSLINRFYEIQSGTITYDGINVRDIQKDSLRRSLGVVLQDTHLFTGTVADNIRYGRLDAADEEVEAAARLAGADGFIRHLPDGYQTVLTSEGGSLSQGERQLLNIARAACANPPVLILDEATSSIDTRTEKLIEKGMDRLMAGRTVFVIAHRLSTVRNAQAILVLEQGQIIERGNHKTLLAQKGKYYQLYTGQFELS